MNDRLPPFEREISPTERLYLAARRVVPQFVIQMFVEGRGELDPAELRRAVAQASRVSPGARLVARGRKWVDSGEAPPVREADGRLFDGRRFDRAPFLRHTLDAYQGPTCEVVLLRGEVTRVVFRVFHGVMDGKGMLLWIEDVFRALRGERLEGSTSALTDLGLLERLGAVTRRAGLLDLDCDSPLGARGGEASCLWKRRSLQGEHPGLVAKLAAILTEASGLAALRFLVPVDMRRHDATLRSTGNLSLPIYLDAGQGERWEQLHERLLTALAERRELAKDGMEGVVATLPIWSLTALLDAFHAVQRRKGRFFNSGILSHLGRVDPADLSTATFAADTLVSLPVQAPAYPLALEAVECADHVELALSCAGGPGMEERAERLLDRIEQALAGAELGALPDTNGDAPRVRDEVETAVSVIWSTILRVETQRLGPDADFYRLGGSSIQMVEMLSAIARRIVGEGREELFMRDVQPILKRPSLESVCQAARRALPAPAR
jgi:hypothetical protein